MTDRLISLDAAVAQAESLLHDVPAVVSDDYFDSLGRYSNGTVRRIVAALRSIPPAAPSPLDATAQELAEWVLYERAWHAVSYRRQLDAIAQDGLPCEGWVIDLRHHYTEAFEAARAAYRDGFVAGEEE